MLFTSLFTIALSINEGIQQNNFRQAGGWSHGTFKYLTEEQFAELKDDPLIESWGLRRFLGMPADVPFNKSHVEIGYSDTNNAHWMYCDPVEGRLPQEGTNEAATDTHVLELLGEAPELGAQFTVTFFVNGHRNHPAYFVRWRRMMRPRGHHILIPETGWNSGCGVGVTPPGSDGHTRGVEPDESENEAPAPFPRISNEILANQRYHSKPRGRTTSPPHQLGYTGAQLSDNWTPS